MLIFPVAGLADSFGEINWYSLPGGTYTWGGDTDHLYGNNIDVSGVQGIGTPSHSSILPLSITNGSLNFETGNSTGGWNWQGGTLTLRGCIPGAVIGCGSSTPGILLSANLQSVSIVPDGLGFNTVIGLMAGSYSDEVASYFGLPTNAFTATSITLDFSFAREGSAFRGWNIGGAIQTNPVAVPEHWDVFSTISSAVFAFAAFAAARRLGLLKLVTQ